MRMNTTVLRVLRSKKTATRQALPSATNWLYMPFEHKVPDKFEFVNTNIEAIIANEPDVVQFNYRGVSCVVRRNRLFWTLCGYVLTDFHDLDIWRDYDVEDNVHGGWTYDRDGVLGFDCAHLGDVIPLVMTGGFDMAEPFAQYRDYEHVVDCLKRTINAFIEKRDAKNKTVL